MSNPLDNQYYCPGVGPSGPIKLAIVGIAPGTTEVAKKIPFVGPTGKILEEALNTSNCDIHSTYRTNIFKYLLPGNSFHRYKEIGLDLSEAIDEVRNEINIFQPNCILGLGDPPLYALAGKHGTNNGIGIWRGSILNVYGRKFIPTYHPAASLHGQEEATQWKAWQSGVMFFDIKRAVDESHTADFNLPQRLLYVAKSSSDVYRFFERNANKEYCAIDIEAIEGIPVCIGFSFAPHEAISIPLWNKLSIYSNNKIKPKSSYHYELEVSTIPTPDLLYIWQILASFLLNPKYKKIGQNFKYDEDKINRLGFYLDKLYADIMIGQHVISSELPKSLAFQTSIYTREPYYKFEGKQFNPKKDKIDDFFIYNARDAAVTIEIFLAQLEEMKQIPRALEHFIDFRMRLHKLYLHIDNVGFAVDEDIRLTLVKKYVQWLIKLEKELMELTGEYINIASPKQVSNLLYEHLKIPMRKGTGEQIITALIANTLKDKVKIRTCEIILEWRRVNKTIGTYLGTALDFEEPDYNI